MTALSRRRPRASRFDFFAIVTAAGVLFMAGTAGHHLLETISQAEPPRSASTFLPPPEPESSDLANELVTSAKANPARAHVITATHSGGEQTHFIFLPWGAQLAGAIRNGAPDQVAASAIVERFFRGTVAEIVAIPGIEHFKIFRLTESDSGSFAANP